MNTALAIVAIATGLLAVGLWLLLPRGAAGGRALGAVVLAASLGLFASQTPGLGVDGAFEANDVVFYILAALTVWSAVATVTFRNPVYCAIWFALSLLGTAGIFLFDGAQFLGVATIVVYAGAILVTFLFVLMLAQPEGQAPYDRVSWAPTLSALSGALFTGLLTTALVIVFQGPQAEQLPQVGTNSLTGEILADEHMAHLGARLFSHHLAAVEVAGTLLLVALVGAVAIVAQIRRPGRKGDAA